MPRILVRTIFLALVTIACAVPARAQRADSTLLRVPIPDTTPAPVKRAVRVLHPEEIPPVTPGRAFLYSLAVPGLGQAALDRRYTGAGFFLVEALSLAMLHRAGEDLRLARAFKGDSVPFQYQMDGSGLVVRNAAGDPVVASWKRGAASDSLIHARQLHYEDWVAVLVFNHLISGADAFVAANLWDFPGHVKFRAAPLMRGGAMVSLTISRK